MKVFFKRNMDEILEIIFLSLDPRSLHTSRQVCHQWNNFIKKLWKIRAFRKRLELKFRKSWLTYAPYVSTATKSGWNIRSIAVDDKLVVCGMDVGRVLLLDKSTEITLANLDTTTSGIVGVVALGDTVIVAASSDGAAANQVAVHVWNKENLDMVASIMWESWEMEYWASRFEILGMKAADGDMFLCLGKTCNVVRVVDVNLQEKSELVHELWSKVKLVETCGPWAVTTVGDALKIRIWNLVTNTEGQSIEVNAEQLGDHQELKDGVIRCMHFDYPTVSIVISSNNNSVKKFMIQNWDFSTGTIISCMYSELTKLYRPKLYDGLLFTIDVRSMKISIYCPSEETTSLDGFIKNEVRHLVGKSTTFSRYGEKAKMFSYVDKKCLIITAPSKITFYRFYK